MSGLCPALVGGDGLRQAFEAVVELLETLDDLLSLDVLGAHLLEIRVVALHDVLGDPLLDPEHLLGLDLRHLLLGGGGSSDGEKAEEGRDPEPVVERDHVSERTHRFLSLSLEASFLRGDPRQPLRKLAYLLMFSNQL